MDIEAIEKLWVKDCQIDRLELARASANIPKLHAKYNHILTTEQKKLIELKETLRSLEFILTEFYGKHLSQSEIDEYELGEYPDKHILKTDVHKWVSHHPDVIEIKKEIGLQIVKVDYVKSIIKEASSMSFQIRNIIEWEKFRNAIV